ncbi:MAG: hypothetical protein JW849_06360 [Phycisphaerae bacterium]|nr:hypothetical protein [Phycisphaerae bacterium]
MKQVIRIITLYKYFAYASHMRKLFREAMTDDWMKVYTPDMQGAVNFFLSPPGIYFMYSYSGIFLVIQGWESLELHDPKIDKLLESPFVDRLRKFRNATFHYQKDMLSPKHLQFFGTQEEKTEEWLNSLYAEFERFFIEQRIPIPESLKSSFKDKTDAQVFQAIKDYFGNRTSCANDDEKPIK